MSCRWSKYTEDGPMCPSTGDRCMFMIPNEKACYEKYGEGPLAAEEDNSDKEMDCLVCNVGKDRACGNCCRDWDKDEEVHE